MEHQKDAHFIELDLNIESKFNLDPLVQHLKEKFFVLYNDEIGNGNYLASLEIDPAFNLPHSPESYTEFVVECIQSLPISLKSLWENATSRVFDFGFGNGIMPPPYPIEGERAINLHKSDLSSALLSKIVDINASVRLTIYPYQPSEQDLVVGVEE